jgi:hypothetical protein
MSAPAQNRSFRPALDAFERRLVVFFTASRRRTRAASRHPTFRPRLDALEDRTVLSATYTVLTATPNPANLGQSVTFTATITGGDVPAGSGYFSDRVTFQEGGLVLKEVTPTPTGGPNNESRAQFTTSGLALGSHAITAQYSGGRDFFPVPHINNPSTSNTVTEVVNLPTPTPTPTPTPADVSSQVSAVQILIPGLGRRGTMQLVTLSNTSGQAIEGPLCLILHGLKRKVRLRNATGLTRKHGHPGDPYLLDNVTLKPGGEVTLILRFSNPRSQVIRFTTEVLAGTGEM